MNDKQLQIVTFWQAKILKKSGFDWKVDRYYQTSADESVYTGRCNELTDVNNRYRDGSVSAPTVALALKWIRDTIKTSNIITSVSVDGIYGYAIMGNKIEKTGICNTFEEFEYILLDALIKELINQ